MTEEHVERSALGRSLSLKSALCSSEQVIRALDLLSNQALLELALDSVPVLKKVGSPAVAVVGSVP